jgi:ABC-2 type transport system ATP-binding protein
MSEYAIETHGLQRNFKTVRAVDDLTLSIQAGSIFGFLGPNGAGKTTTIRLLLGLLEPSAGEARVLGYDIRAQVTEIRQLCGALLEHHGLYERMSAADNLEFYSRIWHISRPERLQRQKSLLENLGLWERRNEIVAEWSRGMKQKLAVARVLFHRPRLVFLDEPTAGLDPMAAVSLREDLGRLAAQEGVTVFLTTHNLAEAEKLCHQVGVIRQGRLIALGSPEALRNRSGSQRVEVRGSVFSERILSELNARPEVKSASLQNGTLRLELTTEASVAPLVSLLVASGAQVEEVRRDTASLEDVFLTLMEEEK